MEAVGNKLCKQGGIDLNQTLPVFNPEDAAAVIISDETRLASLLIHSGCLYTES